MASQIERSPRMEVEGGETESWETSRDALLRLRRVSGVAGGARDEVASAVAEAGVIAQISEHAVFAVDLEGCAITWNAGVERLFGWEREAFIGMPLGQWLVPSDPAAEWISGLLKHLHQHGSFTHEHWLQDRSGRRIFVRGATCRVLDAAGRPCAFVSILQDCTAQQLLQEEQAALLEAERAARVRAERVNRMREEFLATLSHELRTPLSAILGWVQVMQRGGELKPLFAKALQAIDRNARAQVQLIEDLFDTKRIRAGKVKLSIAPTSLADVIGSAVAAIQPAAESKQIDMTHWLDPELPLVPGDPGRLEQVLWNLLSNAVKFTPRGGRIEVRAERRGDRVRVTVADNGVGIEPQLLPRLFDRYRQAADSETEGKGLGLGLALVKQLVGLHGGEVFAESAGRGQGARFVVWLPIQLPERSAASPRHVAPGASGSAVSRSILAGLRILAVDDDADGRELIQQLLEQHGAGVHAAASAQEALGALREHRFDVLVSDLGMPELSGYELIRAVRTLPASEGGTIPAVAFTAFDRQEDRKRASDAGYQGYVTKPVEIHELLNVIREVINHGAAT